MNKMSKKVIVILCFVALAMIGFIIFRLLNPNVGFRYFEPSYLPSDVSIRAKRINILRGAMQAEQSFRTEDWVYSIRQSKADSTGAIGAANEDYDDKSAEPTCTVSSSPAGMRYRLCHWIDYGHTNVYEVGFIKEGTFVYSQIPATASSRIGVQEIETYIDSFEQKSTAGLPVLRSNGP